MFVPKLWRAHQVNCVDNRQGGLAGDATNDFFMLISDARLEK